MKIAITGGAGFIGHRLAENLTERGHKIVIVDTLAPTPVDIMDRDALTRVCAGCDAIYHLAALHSDDVFPRSRYYDVNRDGTANVIAAAKANNINRLIFTSTFALYGLNTGMPDEDSGPQPFNDYGQSKWEAEKILKEWAAEDKARTCTIVRPVVVFGEGNRGNVYTLISQITRGKFVMVGDGTNKKSMAYVGNVAGFLAHCLDRPSGVEVFNYADKPDYTMRDLTKVIYTKLNRPKPALSLPYPLGLSAGYAFDVLARVAGRTFPISAVRVREFCADTTCAADKFKETGFVPQYTLAQGVERMIEADFPHAIEPGERAA